MKADGPPDRAAERRGSRRYGIQQKLTYKVQDRQKRTLQEGTGDTINFSSRGVLFRAEPPRLQVGSRVEISVLWPALLSGTCPLKFVAFGRVLRVEEDCVAVAIRKYEFHTRRTRELPEAFRPQRTGV